MLLRLEYWIGIDSLDDLVHGFTSKGVDYSDFATEVILSSLIGQLDHKSFMSAAIANNTRNHVDVSKYYDYKLNIFKSRTLSFWISGMMTELSKAVTATCLAVRWLC